MLGGFFSGFFWHPLHGNGYQFWSGIAGSFLTSLPGWLVAIGLMARKHNCHVKRCPSVITHHDPAVHAPACKRHHSHRHLRGSVPN
jgi:hypothetical protein